MAIRAGTGTGDTRTAVAWGMASVPETDGARDSGVGVDAWRTSLARVTRDAPESGMAEAYGARGGLGVLGARGIGGGGCGKKEGSGDGGGGGVADVGGGDAGPSLGTASRSRSRPSSSPGPCSSSSSASARGRSGVALLSSRSLPAALVPRLPRLPPPPLPPAHCLVLGRRPCIPASKPRSGIGGDASSRAGAEEEGGSCGAPVGGEHGGRAAEATGGGAAVAFGEADAPGEQPSAVAVVASAGGGEAVGEGGEGGEGRGVRCSVERARDWRHMAPSELDGTVGSRSTDWV